MPSHENSALRASKPIISRCEVRLMLKITCIFIVLKPHVGYGASSRYTLNPGPNLCNTPPDDLSEDCSLICWGCPCGCQEMYYLVTVFRASVWSLGLCMLAVAGQRFARSCSLGVAAKSNVALILLSFL